MDRLGLDGRCVSESLLFSLVFVFPFHVKIGSSRYYLSTLVWVYKVFVIGGLNWTSLGVLDPFVCFVWKE